MAKTQTQRLDAIRADVGDARRELASNLTARGVAASQDERLSALVPKVLDIDQGGEPGSGEPGSPDQDKPVLFYDYDGTLLYSYTIAQAQALTELPALPAHHQRLVAQRWTHTLEQVNGTVGPLHAGASYTTVSGATEIDIDVNGATGTAFQMRTQQTGGTLTVDWGDGTSDNYTGTSATIRSHTYSERGGYTVKLSVSEGSTYQIIGTSTSVPGFGTSAIAKMVKSCHFGRNVTDVGGYVFYGCHCLTSVTIPHGVTNINTGAFYNCYSLRTAIVPHGVANIPNSTFYDCYCLTKVVLPQSVTSMSSNIFVYCYCLPEIILPPGVTTIGDGAFNYCYSLKSIVMPQGVTNIGANAFNNCYSLQSIVMPQGLTGMGTSAFANCYSLKSMVVPKVLTSISGNVFQNCYSCLEYSFSHVTPLVLPSNSFTGIVPLCRIYVPDGSVEAYKTATNWIAFANYIHPSSQRPAN